jgi:hypothetical protein
LFLIGDENAFLLIAVQNYVKYSLESGGYMFQTAIQFLSRLPIDFLSWSSFQNSLLSRHETYGLLYIFNLLDGYLKLDAILAMFTQFQFPDMPLKIKNEKKIIIVSVIFF